jgi:membrane-anchored glycerophosphoryl diester phosphodiesterase (GDPDase)
MLLGASLLVGLGVVAAMIPLLLLVGGGAMLGGARPEVLVGPILLLTLILVVGSVALWVRLMLMTPVTAAENEGPIGIIRRSWDLTRGHFWKLLGFVLLVILLFLVISMVEIAIGGLLVVLVAGPPDPGSAAAFILALIDAAVNMVITVYFTALIARIYLQLSDRGPEAIFV